VFCPDTPVLAIIPCRPGMACCCSHSCRVHEALQWLGVEQHSPTTSPATWISEDSNHYRWKEEIMRSPGPTTSPNISPNSTTLNSLFFLWYTKHFVLLQVVPLLTVLCPIGNTEHMCPGYLTDNQNDNFPFPSSKIVIPFSVNVSILPMHLMSPSKNSSNAYSHLSCYLHCIVNMYLYLLQQ
jgi:hypothetical protein